jgi:hypothetical protein
MLIAFPLLWILSVRYDTVFSIFNWTSDACLYFTSLPVGSEFLVELPELEKKNCIYRDGEKASFVYYLQKLYLRLKNHNKGEVAHLSYISKLLNKNYTNIATSNIYMRRITFDRTMGNDSEKPDDSLNQVVWST